LDRVNNEAELPDRCNYRYAKICMHS